MRLSGWQRLWVLLSVLYFITVLVVVSVAWPSIDGTPHRDDFIARMPAEARTHVVASYANRQSAREHGRDYVRHVMPNGAVLVIRGKPDPRLVAFRKKYPEYDDLSDADLTEKLRAKFAEYADLPPSGF